jgi:putative transposase
MNNELPQRKRLVHVPPVEHHNAPVVLFVTIGIQPRKPFLANTIFQNSFNEAIIEANAWRVSSYLLMPDHIHLFALPATFSNVGIMPWVTFLKRRVTSKLGSHPEWEWQSGCFDRQMRTLGDYEEQLSYMRMNPVAAGLVDSPEKWPWQREFDPVTW